MNKPLPMHRRSSSISVMLFVVFIVSGLVRVPVVFGEPVAEWATPWIVHLTHQTREQGLALVAFGLHAANGEVMDTGTFFETMPGTPAFARAQARANGGFGF